MPGMASGTRMPHYMACVVDRVTKELLAGEASTRLEGAAAIDVPALLDREYRLNLYSYTQVRGLPAKLAAAARAASPSAFASLGKASV